MLVTIQKYAKLSDCTSANIGHRIKKGYIKVSKKKLPDGSIGKYIDTRKFPPMRMREKKKIDN
jgi:hypothetical protein